MDHFLRDLRIGLRVLIKEKSFCALAVSVIALGICGVTTMFGVVNGVMLRGFSFPNGDRLVSLRFVDPTTRTFFGVNERMSSADFEELLPTQQSFEVLASYIAGSTVNVTDGGQARRYTGAYVTPQFLRALGVPPAMGRDFMAADNVPGAPKVTIISHLIWQRDFGGAPDVVGRAVRINGTPAEVVGVMAQGFSFPTNEELWLPLYSEFPPRPRTDRVFSTPDVLGILKPGVSVDQATLEFSGIAHRFAGAYPETNRLFHSAEVKPLLATFTPVQLRGTLLTMLGFCVGVLLIACVNVMNMQFARAALRTRELAIRSSLGGNRGRLLRQMLTESLLVAALGTIVGVALAYGAIDWLSASVRNLDNPPPSWITFDVDGVVLAVTIGATLLAAVVSGLLPAWVSSRASAITVLREGGRGNTSRTVRLISRSLVVFQIVVTCVLLIGSLLQTRSIIKQQAIDYGYDTRGLMSGRMGLMQGDYPTADARRMFYDRLLQSMPGTPEFEAVALTTRFRMVFSGSGPVEIEGQVYQRDRDRTQANSEQVTSGFFAVTGQKVLEGRLFTDEDHDQRQPIAVVNAAFAQKHFPDGSAVGRRFRTTNPDGTNAGPWRTIVGMVSTIRMLGPFNNPNVDESGFYVPFYATTAGPAQPPFATQFATLLVRPRQGQSIDAMGNVLRREVRKADPNLPLYFVGTPASQLESFVGQNRIIATMFSIFGVVAIVIASVGIYGVMSFSVNQRTQEFGLRMALGANGIRILGMVLRQGGLQIVLGIGLGLLMSLGLAALLADGIQNTLFGVSPRDPLTYTLVVALVAIVSLAAVFIPARRATRVDPMIALRAE